MIIKKVLKFCASHRLIGHEGKCKNIHGHNYVVEVYVSNDVLDSVGRVVDFAVIKASFGKWLDGNFDHAMIINSQDTDLINFCTTQSSKYYLMPGNATAENMAELFFKQIVSIPQKGVVVEKVVVWETDTGAAEYAEG